MVPTRCFALLLLWASLTVAEGTRRVHVTTEVTAAESYETGLAHDVLRSPDGRGVQLNDLVLIENDSPGAGYSEKGTWHEPIHRGVLARKTLTLQNASAKGAHVVVYLQPQRGRHSHVPYYLIVNGHRLEGNPIPWHEGVWHWVRVPVEWLQTGDNEILIGCDAPEDEGYHLLLAREDEYEAGGGKYALEGNPALICGTQVEVADDTRGGFQPIDVGKHSAKSTDGGRTWITGALGATNDVLGEYAVRLSLGRHKPRGRLQSGPIDLWSGVPGYDEILPQCHIEDLRFEVAGETPPGTRIAWSVRFADTADMTSGQWTAFRPVADRPQGVFPLPRGAKRYLQWQAELTTDDPLNTPVVHGVKIHRQLQCKPPAADALYVRRYENVQHRYSSYEYAYEDCQHPELRALRERLDLDRVLEGTRGDFERINRLRHLVSGLWPHGTPMPEHPEWNAHEILDRKARLGRGGMCTQFAIVFIQCLQALGYQARHVNVFAHETVEVYVDELGKWVHVDPENLFDSYEYNTVTGEPINVLEQHGYFLRSRGFSAEHPIDWMSARSWAWPAKSRETPQPLSYSTFTGRINDPADKPPQHRLVGFIRMIPRSDFLSRPYPRPLNQGMGTHWPWNGYLNWFDEATPRKLQYALHSDRPADFYPTLNRVEFSAVFGDEEGDLVIEMSTFAPNFDGFEINVDDTGWASSPARFIWSLRPSAVNALQMRVGNKGGPLGKPSGIQVLWNYREPFPQGEP